MNSENIDGLTTPDLVEGQEYELAIDCKFCDQTYPKGTKVVFDGYRPLSSQIHKRNPSKVAWFVFPNDTPGHTRCLMKSEIVA